ncbi:MAG: ATP-binding cassette domain-containing protein [Anaerolineae bacterium]|nr:ATP-binding cassette domain-containing protein [Anaerolineae bacterium]
MSSNGDDVPVVRMEKIVKRFGTVVALDGVDLTVNQNEVLCLLGDNGAGKSTLIKILTGIYTPTSGRIAFYGAPVDIRTPAEARALGIETVYQDLALVNLMSIARNFFLGRELARAIGPVRWLDMRAMNERTRAALADVGIHIRSASEKVEKLSGGERQSIAIGRALHFGARLLILDEPTSALSVAETRKVLTYVTSAKERGLSVIFITHNMHHAMMVADRFTILRQGQLVGNYAEGEVTQDDLADLVMGQREV